MDIEVHHCAFDLHPGIPLEGQPVPWDPETRAKRGGQFAKVAVEEGLEVGERTHWYNATRAHEASEWASEFGAGDEFRRRVFRTYFLENRNIASLDVLGEIATSLKLDAMDLSRAIEDGKYTAEVHSQYELCQRIGVTAVPTFVVEGHALVGAHPLENMRKLLAMEADEGASQ